MTRWRTTPTNLRVLLLGALGASVWACSGKTTNCVEGDESCEDGVGGTSTDESSTGGTNAGGTSAGGTSAGGASAGGTESTGGSAGSGTGGTESTGGSGGTVNQHAGCTDPVPYLEGVDTGIFRCEEGHLWRHEATECQSVLPRPGTVDWPSEENGPYTTSADECDEDADCDENATCVVRNTAPMSGCLQEPPPEVPDYERVCWAGCREDSDCGTDQVCICGEEIGRCEAISPVEGCQQDADCEPGFLCLRNARANPFSGPSFACQLPFDACNTDADCQGGGEYCAIGEGGRICETAPVCGRPFLIASEARIAEPVASAAWRASAELLDLSKLMLPSDGELRERLVEHWTHIGLLEHASVAAFARFTLQLISVGAPAELVEASQKAALDEIRHAELAFALASRYAGRDIGPGPLPMTGALDAASLDDILRTTVREGCIGETQAALEASRAAEGCEDPIVRAILETIAADEARHAELAWRVVRHLVTAHPETAHTLAEEFGLAERRERGAPSRDGVRASERTNAARLGVLEPATLDDCHRVAHREVIGPCARALIAGAALLAA